MINGLREIGRALDGGLNVQEFYFCPELCESEAARGLLNRLKSTAAAPFEVSESVFFAVGLRQPDGRNCGRGKNSRARFENAAIAGTSAGDSAGKD